VRKRKSGRVARRRRRPPSPFFNALRGEVEEVRDRRHPGPDLSDVVLHLLGWERGLGETGGEEGTGGGWCERATMRGPGVGAFFSLASLSHSHLARRPVLGRTQRRVKARVGAGDGGPDGDDVVDERGEAGGSERRQGGEHEETHCSGSAFSGAVFWCWLFQPGRAVDRVVSASVSVCVCVCVRECVCVCVCATRV